MAQQIPPPPPGFTLDSPPPSAIPPPPPGFTLDAAPTPSPRAPASAYPAGMLEPGTDSPYDYAKFPPVRNPDGSTSNVRTMSFNIDGKEVLLPTMAGGKPLVKVRPDRTIDYSGVLDRYHQTGEHFGIFDTPESANAFANDVENKMQAPAATPAAPPKRRSFLDSLTAAAGAEEAAAQPLFAPPELSNELPNPNAREEGYFEALPKQALTGLEQFATGVLGGVQSALTSPPEPNVPMGANEAPLESGTMAAARAQYAKEGPIRKLSDSLNEDMQNNVANVRPFSASGITGQVLASAPTMLAGVIASMMTRNPEVGAAVMGGLTYGQEYSQEISEGVDPDWARLGAFVNGVSEAAGENIPLGFMMKPGGSFLKSALKTAGAEGVQELLTQIVQTGYDKGVLHPEMTWGEAWSQVVQAGIVGAVMGGGFHAMMRPFQPEVGSEEIDEAARAAGIDPDTLHDHERAIIAAKILANRKAPAPPRGFTLDQPAAGAQGAAPTQQAPKTPAAPSKPPETAPARATEAKAPEGPEWEPLYDEEGAQIGWHNKKTGKVQKADLSQPPAEEPVKKPPESEEPVNVGPTEGTEPRKEPEGGKVPERPYDFVKTFPLPQEDAIREEGRETIFPDGVPEDQKKAQKALKAWHDEAAISAAEPIAAMAWANEVLKTGIDPETGKEPRTPKAKELLKKEAEDALKQAPEEFEGWIGQYADHFGPQAAADWQHFLLESYDDGGFMRKATDEARAKRLQDYAEDIKKRMQPLEDEEGAVTEPSTDDLVQIEADKAEEAAEAQANFEPEEGWDKSIYKARDAAKGLGIEWQGKNLTDLTKEINDHLATRAEERSAQELDDYREHQRRLRAYEHNLAETKKQKAEAKRPSKNDLAGWNETIKRIEEGQAESKAAIAELEKKRPTIAKEAKAAAEAEAARREEDRRKHKAWLENRDKIYARSVKVFESGRISAAKGKAKSNTFAEFSIVHDPETGRYSAPNLSYNLSTSGGGSFSEPNEYQNISEAKAGVTAFYERVLAGNRTGSSWTDSAKKQADTLLQKIKDTLAGVTHTPAKTEPAKEPEPKSVPWHGLPITITTKKGETRYGPIDEKTGKPKWEHANPLAAYGEIERTRGADKEPLDVILVGFGQKAFVFDQLNPETGKFDEHKAVLGAKDLDQAKDAFDANYGDRKGPERRANGGVEMTAEEFKRWVKEGDTKTAIVPQAIEAEKQKPIVSQETKVPSEEDLQSGKVDKAILQRDGKYIAWTKTWEGPPRPDWAAAHADLLDRIEKEKVEQKAEVERFRNELLARSAEHNGYEYQILEDDEPGEYFVERTHETEDTKKIGGRSTEYAAAQAAVADAFPGYDLNTEEEIRKEIKDNRAAYREEERRPATTAGREREKAANMKVLDERYKQLERALLKAQHEDLFAPKKEPESALPKVPGETPETGPAPTEVAEEGAETTGETEPVIEPEKSPEQKDFEQFLTMTKRARLGKTVYTISAVDKDNWEGPWTLKVTREGKAEIEKEYPSHDEAREAAIALAFPAKEPAAEQPETGEGVTKAFYVTMIREPGPKQKVAWLAGPFATHEEALAMVDRAKETAHKLDAWSDFDSFGTASREARTHPPGKLNKELGLPNDPRKPVEPPKDKRARVPKMEDVGEAMAGKRAQAQKRMPKGADEKALETLLAQTRESFDLKERLASDATTGAQKFALEIQGGLKSFLEYEGGREGGGRKKWHDPFSKALADAWASAPDKVKESAAKYIATMEALGDVIAGAKNVTEIHAALRSALLGPKDFQAQYDAVSKGPFKDAGVSVNLSGYNYKDIWFSKWGTDGKEKIDEADLPEQLKPLAKELKHLKQVESRGYSDFGGEVREYLRSYGWPFNWGLTRDKPYIEDSDQVPNRATPLVRPAQRVEDIQRVGLPERRKKGENITAEKFRETFGFRGVEFGNWVTGKEGRAHVNAAYDALLDFAETMKMPVKAISLGGRLGLAFGSRGKGRHAAHFEPSTFVINLTKTKGDGTVAHEWGHALDYYLRAVGGGAPSVVQHPDVEGKWALKYANGFYVRNAMAARVPGAISVWETKADAEKYGVPAHTLSAADRVAKIDDEIRKAAQAIRDGTIDKADANKLIRPLNEERSALSQANQSTAELLRSVRDNLTHTWDIEGALAQLDRLLRGVSYIVGRKSLGPIKTAEMYVDHLWQNEGWSARRNTNYKREADELGKGYWGNPEELWARSFEAFIYDEMAAKGQASPYLVNQWVAEGNTSKAQGYRGTPYPTEDERQNFASMWRNVLGQFEWTEDGTLKPKTYTKIPNSKDAVAEALKKVDIQKRWAEIQKEGRPERRTGPLSEEGGGPSPPVPPEGVPRPEGEGPTGSGSEESGGSDSGRDQQPTTASDPGRAPGREDEGGREAPTSGVGGAEGGASEGRGNGLEDRPERRVRGLNFRIAENKNYATGSARERIEKNISAIRLVLDLEKGQQFASKEDQEQLAHYVGWGATELAKLFDEVRGKSPELVEARERLKKLLNPTQYQLARETTPNAHYTSQDVVRGVWDAFKALGFEGNGTVLEPGMGIGNFMGMRPEGVEPKFVGVEMDDITGKIGRALYPQARIMVQPFESAKLPENAFDAVIGNVPFMKMAPADKVYNKSKLSLHNYFIYKSLHLLKPGGIMGVVTSRYTMDSVDSSARQKFFEAGADLIGAIRLPNTAFKENAGTQVVTDILFFRKRLPGEEPRSNDWLKTKQITVYNTLLDVNNYFAKNPAMILGEQNIARGQFTATDYTVDGDAKGLRKKINAAVERMLKKSDLRFNADPNNQSNPLDSPYDELAAPPDELKDHAFFERDGKLYQKVMGRTIEAEIPEGQHERVKQLIKLRDKAREILNAQRTWDGVGAEPWKPLQAELSKLHDKFVKKFGFINTVNITSYEKDGKEIEQRRYPNLTAFRDDPDAPLVQALENYDEEKNTGTKSDIFTHRVLEPDREVTKVDTPDEALIASLNMKGGVDLPYMAKLLDRPVEGLAKDLKGRIYKNPANGAFELAELYLAGNVRAKLAIAKQAAAVDAAYKDNVEALEKVQPEDLKPSQIGVRMGAPWIPNSDVEDFVTELLGSQAVIEYVNKEAVWLPKIADDRSANNIETWAVKWGSRGDYFRNMNAVDGIGLVSDVLNQRVTKIEWTEKVGDTTKTYTDTQAMLVAQEKQDQIKELFAQWLWKDPERAERLGRFYNDTFNNLKVPVFSGAHLTLPGSSSKIDLRSTQKKSVWRFLVMGNTLLDHVVGAGKTFTAIAAAMESKRLGLLNKPLFAVPNHMLEQFSREFVQLYPNANLLIADERNFEGDNRRRFVARAAAGNWDAVIMTHSSFERIGMSQGFQESYLREELAEYEALIKEEQAKKGGKDRLTVKKLVAAKKQREAKLKALMEGKEKDTGLTFEDTGIDGLFIDEAHLFKNLELRTKMENVGPSKPSQRATDLYLKTRYLDSLRPGRGVMFMTGTPISNSMAEAYTMQKYLAPRLLAERGVSHFDAWASTFGDTVTKAELAPEGGRARLKSRFAKFRNVPELIQMYRQFADYVSKQDLLDTGVIKLPKIMGGKPQTIEMQGSDALHAYIKELGERADAVRNKEVDADEDNMLMISNDGRAASMDMRLIDPKAKPDKVRKATVIADKVADIYHSTTPNKSTQLIFADLAVPNSRGAYSVHDDIRAELIKRGVKANEIALIHDADTNTKKARLFSAMRSGKVRILIGTTDKMGVGTNVQKRLIALHHADPRWRPSDIEQREGRIERQGNDNDEIQIYRYVTVGSFDAYMYQTMERKAGFIAAVKKGDLSIREMEDIGDNELSYAEAKALAAGNPLILDKAKIDHDVNRLKSLRGAHFDSINQMEWRLRRLPDEIASVERRLEALNDDIKTAEENFAKAPFIIAGKKFEFGGDKSPRPPAAKAMGEFLMAKHQEALKQIEEEQKRWGTMKKILEADPPLQGQLGSAHGFKLSYYVNGRYDPTVFIEGKVKRPIRVEHLGAMEAGLLASIENEIRRTPAMAEDAKQEIDRLEKLKADYAVLVKEPFTKQKELEAALKRQHKIDLALGLTEPNLEDKLEALQARSDDIEKRYKENAVNRYEYLKEKRAIEDERAKLGEKTLPPYEPEKRTTGFIVPEEPGPMGVTEARLLAMQRGMGGNAPLARGTPERELSELGYKPIYDQDMYGYVVGFVRKKDGAELESWSDIPEKEERARDVARAIQNGNPRRTHPIKRGVEPMIQRLIMQSNLDAARNRKDKSRVTPIQRADIRVVENFIDFIGPWMFNNVGFRFRASKGEEGSSGNFNTASKIVTIFRRAVEFGSLPRTAVHELWHYLDDALPYEDDVAMYREFHRARTKWLANNEWAYSFIDPITGDLNNTLRGDAAEFWQAHWGKQSTPVHVFKDDQGTTVARFEWTDANYRYKNRQEYFAETMSDRYFDHLSIQDKKVASIFEHVRDLFRRMVADLKRLWGADASGRIFDGFKAGEYQPPAAATGFGDVYDQVAYHGTPHDFEKFSTSKIGTGEGAQVYGWGLYFAGKREVADFYRQALAGQSTNHWYFELPEAERLQIIRKGLLERIAATSQVSQEDKDALFARDDEELEKEIKEAADAKNDFVGPKAISRYLYSEYGRSNMLYTLLHEGGYVPFMPYQDQTAIGYLNSALTWHPKDATPESAMDEIRQKVDSIERLKEQSRRDEDRAKAHLEQGNEELARSAKDFARNSRWFAEEYEKMKGFLERHPEAKPFPPQIKGRLYQVKLAPRDDEWLDWDVKLPEQSPTVQAALAKINDPVVNAWRTNGAWPNVSGHVLYDHLAGRLARRKEGQQHASEYLHSLGIRGIRYPDQGSRHVTPERKKEIERAIGQIRENLEIARKNTALFDEEFGRQGWIEAKPEDLTLEKREGQKYTFKTGLPGTRRATAVGFGGNEEEAKASAIKWANSPLMKGAVTSTSDRELIAHYEQRIKDFEAELATPITYNFVVFNDADIDVQAKFQMLPTFYSALERAVSESSNKKASASQWQAFLRNTPGLKQDEIDWSGVKEWLGKQEKPVTKDDLVQFIRENGANVQEVKLGGPQREENTEYPADQDEWHTSPTIIRDPATGETSESITASDATITFHFDPDGNVQHVSAEVAGDDLGDFGDFIEAREAVVRYAAGRILGVRQEAGRWWLYDQRTNMSTMHSYPTREEALRAAAEMEGQGQEQGRPTQFSRYTLPEGEDYTELLITLPPKVSPEPAKATELPAEFHVGIDYSQPESRRYHVLVPGETSARPYSGRHATPQAARADALAHYNFVQHDKWFKAEHAKQFKSGHFDAPNIIAHVRFKTRIDANGKKTLFIEEIQSDWHQRGRKFGYRKTLTELPEGYTVIDSGKRFTVQKPDGYWIGAPSPTREGAVSNALAILQRESDEKTVPEAPFKTSWHELALKRMLRYAAENGYDQIAWTTGKQQADRYGLAQVYDAVRVIRHGDGTYGLSTRVHGGRDFAGVGLSVTEDRLAEYVGAELAARIVADKIGTGAQKTYSGLDLELGGEGMKGFYDRIVPQFLNKYAKKWGAQVGKTTIPLEEVVTGKPVAVVPHPRTGGYTIELKDNTQGYEYMGNWGQDKAAAEAALKRVQKDPWALLRTAEVHSLPITPTMRDSVMGGQPLFQNPRGWETAGALAEEEQTKIMRGPYVGEPIVNPTPQEEALIKAVRDIIRRLSPSAPVDVFGAIRSGNQSLGGFYEPLKQIISVSLKEPLDGRLRSTEAVVRTAAHEVIHFLRATHLITPEEWEILEQAAAKEGWREQFHINKRYAHYARDELRTEEAIAEAFADGFVNRWMLEQGRVTRIFVKIDRFLRQVKDAFKQLFGMKASAADLFIRYETGEFGSRPDSGAPFRRAGVGAMAQVLPNAAPGPGANIMEQTAPLTPFERYTDQPQPSVVQYLKASNLSLMQRLKGATSFAAINKTFDDWRQGFQDRFIRVARVQDVIERTLGRPLNEDENAYLSEELSAGRKGARIEDLFELRVRPLIMAMHEAGISREELETFLYARHAPERNARIQEINPTFVEEGIPGSGMSDEDAAAIMNAVDASGRRADYDALASMVDDILEFALDTRYEAGLMTEEQYEAVRGRYQNYVPLKGEADLDPELEADRPRTGRAFDVKGKEFHRAFGRESEARDILAYSIMQAEEAIIRSENNRIGNAILKLAEAAPNSDFWKVDKVTIRPVWIKATEEVQYQAQQRITAEDAPYTISTKVEGKEHRITFNRKNPVAREMSESFKNLGQDQVSTIIRTFGVVNRMLSHVNTTLNPEFVITNAFRDAITALGNIQKEDIAGITKGTIRDYRKALVASTRTAFHADTPSLIAPWQASDQADWDRWAREFREHGGRVYFNQMEDVLQLRKKLDKEMRLVGTSDFHPVKAFKTLGQTIENANIGVENGIRLSAYKNARERGFSPAKAASLAKNLTVNFNRRGSWGPLMNSMYLFYNASVQGTFTLLTAWKSPRVRKLAGAAVITGFLLEFLNMMLSGIDDDGEPYYDKVTDYDKSRNLIIMDPTGSRYDVKIPLPYGYNIFFAVGRSIGEIMRGKDWLKSVGNLANTTIDAFNPIGGAQSLLNIVAPTILDPLVDLMGTGKDYTGRPIAPTQDQSGPQVPASQRYWNSVSPVWKTITDFLSSATGGTGVEPGLIEISPEWLDYLFGQALGAAGQFYWRTFVDFPMRLVDPNSTVSFNDVPLARRVIGSKPPWIDKELFYERVGEIEQARAYERQYAREGRRPEAREFVRKDRSVLQLYGPANNAREELSTIRSRRGTLAMQLKQKRITKERYNEQMRILGVDEDGIIRHFNETYLARTKKRP